MNPVSNTTTTVFDLIVQNAIPSTISDTKRHQLINLALARLNSFYVDNDLGIYNPTIEIDFYNVVNDFQNTRDLTRWVGISPPDFIATKLLSCNLKEANPEIVEMPAGVSYIQDIPITIGDSSTANTEVPDANTGLCCLREATKLFNVLTLGSTNSWTNLASITALLTYYRPVIIPDWARVANIDCPEKDFALVVDYILNIHYGRLTPNYVLEEIQQFEFERKFV